MDGLHPLEKERSIITNEKIGMEYDKSCSLEEWQTMARAKLSELLGLPYEKCHSRFTVEFVEEHKEYTETRFTFHSEENYIVPCHFLEPKTSRWFSPPLMICLQGHSTGMHISLGRPKFEGDDKKISMGDRDFARQAVKRGMCAVTIEQRCFGEKGGMPRPDCHAASMTALLSGRTIIGGRVWDIMRMIDVVTKRFGDKFDTSRIFCAGNSGGGTATFYATALEPRITAAMPSCAFCTFEDSIATKPHCECNYVPNIRKYFDMAELAGMIAPRPLVIVSGEEDGIFPLPGARHEYHRTKNIYYASSEKPENLKHVIGPEGHRFYADLAWPEFLRLI